METLQEKNYSSPLPQNDKLQKNINKPKKRD